MLKKLTKGFLVFALVFGYLASPAQSIDVELSKDSTLEGILQRGELRIGLEAGYMPFEMIDKRGGLRQRDLRHGGVRRKARHVSFIGFDIDSAAIEEARSVAKEAQLTNVEFVVSSNMLDSLKHHTFDYILAHGLMG